MAEKRTRRRFTAAFKTQAVKRLMEGGRGLSTITLFGGPKITAIDVLPTSASRLL